MIRFVSLRRSLAVAFPLLFAMGQPALAQPKEPQAQQRGDAAQKPAGKTPAAQDGKPSAASQKDQKKGSDKKGAKSATAGPGGAKGGLVATFDDWTVYATGQARDKLCYALSKPKDRQPKDLKRGPGYLFVSFQPSKNIRNEIAVVTGFDIKDTVSDGPSRDAKGRNAAKQDAEGQLVIGASAFALLGKDQNAWLKNPAEESRVVAAMTKGQTLIVKAVAKSGGRVTDNYSLNGFGPALERARKECS